MKELFEAYLEDFKDTLLLLNDAIMRMQKGERSKEVLNAVFRVAHTIKGNSAGVEFFRLEKVMHTMEDILQEIRDGKRVLSDGVVRLLFDCYDFLEDSVQVIERTQQDSSIDTSGILAKIDLLNREEKQQSSDLGKQETEPKKEQSSSRISSVSVSQEKEASARNFTLSTIDPDLVRVMVHNSKDKHMVYRVIVELSDASQMKNVRVYMIYGLIDRFAQFLHSTPARMTEDDLRNPNYEVEVETIEIFVMAEDELVEMRKELLTISDIIFVQIEPITRDILQEEYEVLCKEQSWVQTLQIVTSSIATWEISTPDVLKCNDVTQSILSILQEGQADLPPSIVEWLKKFGGLMKLIGERVHLCRREQITQLQLFIQDIKSMIMDQKLLAQSLMIMQIEHILGALQKHFQISGETAGVLSAPVAGGGGVSPVEADVKATKTEAPKESSIIRVPIQKVDELMDMLGELLILNSQMEQKVTQWETIDTDLNNVLSRSAKLIRSIQGLSMSLRMVEIKPTLHRLTRIARDTAKDLQKRITIEIEGEDTEIDRSASEKLFDPLMHLVRNAVSHGIEPEEERIRLGKRVEGQLTLRVYSKRGNVYIEIEDDGQGINIERVLQKARKQGLALENKDYSEDEIIKFIFHPGFSTQEVINNISGRGVGMNVVEAEINKMGGKVEIVNHPGKGARFVVRIPMNLAVLNGTVAEVAGGRYIFPTLFIKQFYIPQKADWVSMQGKSKAIRVREHIIPVVTAQDLFHERTGGDQLQDQQVIILELEQKHIAFPVDRIISRQEIVSKPLGREFAHVGFATGAAILGDGNVSVILDVEAMFSLTNKGA